MVHINVPDTLRIETIPSCSSLLTNLVASYTMTPFPNAWDNSGNCLEQVVTVRVIDVNADPADAECMNARSVHTALTLSGWTSYSLPNSSPNSFPTPSGHKFVTTRETGENWYCVAGTTHDRKAEENKQTSSPHTTSAKECHHAHLTLKLTPDSNTAPEGYSIQTSDSGKTPTVTLSASTPEGYFYGALTIASLVKDQLLTSGTAIHDNPRFTHRGFMLDLARSYQPIEVLHNVIDAAARLKLNVLHLHLVDDQGWRIEITNDGRLTEDTTDYTRLHRISGSTAVSAGKNPGFDENDDTTGNNALHEDTNSGFEEIPPGKPGWYTQKELRSLVAYAKKRHIRIIPELEFPGHNHSVLYALPELATAGAWVNAAEQTIEAWPRWQVGYSYLDFDNPQTWIFTEHVLRQCAHIFGTHSIHLGADECYKLIEAVGQERYDEILERVVELAHECGFEQVSVWQEGVRALSATHSRTDAVQLWNYTAPHVVDELLNHAQHRGVDIINSDARHLYLDQKINLEDARGLTWAVAEGLPTRQTYEWDPLQHIPHELHSHVRGIEACLWSETVRTIDDIAYLCLPRLAAIAEVAWTEQKQRHWLQAAKRLALD